MTVPANLIQTYRVQTGTMVLGLGPRYRKPQDDTTTFGIRHRTTGGYTGVLLEREQIPLLAGWLGRTISPYAVLGGPPPPVAQSDGSSVQSIYYRHTVMCGSDLMIRDLQNTADCERYDDGSASFRVKWNGSGESRSILISSDQATALASFLTIVDRSGWTAWKSGVHTGRGMGPAS